MYAIERDPILADERPHTLAGRVERVLQTLTATAGKPCAGCTTPVCAHDALASLVLGFEREPRCVCCLASETTREVSVLRDQLTSFVLSKDCLAVGWRWAAEREPQCSWSSAQASRRVGSDGNDVVIPASDSGVVPKHDASWNAGDLACGELLLELRLRLRAMAPGTIIEVTALDPAAPQDLPAWCRLTGHALVYAAHPAYFIRRKED